MTIYSFLLFLALFLFIGLLSVRKRQKSADDYLLASRQINPAFAGISAAASTASGFGFTGFIGFSYMHGLSAFWFIFGAIGGVAVALPIVAKKFREHSEQIKACCYSEYLVSNMGEGKGRYRIQLFIGLITLIATLLYATAQLAAGSKALHVLFEWDYSIGSILGAIIVLIYCWAGGIRASIWTDVAQSIVMLAAMLLLLGAAFLKMGWFTGLYDSLAAINPDLISLVPPKAEFGVFFFILGWLFIGISFIGFPHVMVRFMTLDSPKNTNRAIGWYVGYYGAFYMTAFLVGLCTRVLLPEGFSFDPELALPTLSLELLPQVLVGVILAGIFASTISTADSLILSGTASLSRDIFRKYESSYMFLKLSTVVITAIALAIALSGSQNVFSLVMFSVSIMGASFAPLIIIRAMGWPMHSMPAFCMMTAALAVVVSWRILGYHQHVYEALPAFAVAFLVYGVFLVCFQPRALKKSE